MGYRGAIFDVDGVLVASPHERAWQEVLQLLFETEWSDIQPQTSYRPERFTPEVYREYVSGKPRLSGAVAALNYFGVPDADQRARRYAERKQQYLVELIERGEFEPYPDGLRFILAVRAMGTRVAAASSSKNAGLFMKQIRLDTFSRSQGKSYPFVSPGMTLLEFFEADVCGRDLPRGKPYPDIFQTAADELGLPHESCYVVEDAVSGIQAAKAAGMAALGTARFDDEASLAEAGADLVVTSLDEVALEELAQGRLVKRVP